MLERPGKNSEAEETYRKSEAMLTEVGMAPIPHRCHGTRGSELRKPLVLKLGYLLSRDWSSG